MNKTKQNTKHGTIFNTGNTFCTQQNYLATNYFAHNKQHSFGNTRIQKD